jgi:hypothetical protein
MREIAKLVEKDRVRREADRESDMSGRTLGHLTLMTIVCVVIFLVFMAIRPAGAGETPVYGPDGKYQGSVFDYGRTQTYTDRNGQFTGSAVNNGNGTTSFFNRKGQFNGSAGSSIDRAFNFNRR